MSSDARMALEALTTALNEHLVAAQNKRGEDDPAVEAAMKLGTCHVETAGWHVTRF